MEDLKEFSDKEIMIRFTELTDVYDSHIDANWHLVASDIDDAIYVSYVREGLHEYMLACQERNLDVDHSRIDRLDKIWKSWILKCISDGEVDKPFYDMPEEPTKKWWFHIETLDKLNASKLDK